MELFSDSCEKRSQYPKNLIDPNAFNRTLESCHLRIQEQSINLFDSRNAAVNFLESREAEKGFHPSCVTSLVQLKQHLSDAWQPEASDPQFRFIFLNAKSSRDPLRITYDMFNLLLSYHQVPHTFLDFVFSFGKQIEARDFHFGGLREDSRLDSMRKSISIPKIGRSGIELRVSYNLRSVEPVRSQASPKYKQEQNLNWSVRQCAAYHSFDVKTGKSLWINVKANAEIKQRVTEACAQPPLSCAWSPSETFRASLATHLILCEWSGENWRWYINDLEDKLRYLTKDVLAIPIDRNPSVDPYQEPCSPMSPSKSFGPFTSLSRMSTNQFPTSPILNSPKSPSRAMTNASLWSRAPTLTQGGSFKNEITSKSDHIGIKRSDGMCRGDREESKNIKKILGEMASSIIAASSQFWVRNHEKLTHDPEINKKPPRTDGRKTPDEKPLMIHAGDMQKPENHFEFRDLQTIQWIEEKAQEALHIMSLNAETLEDLRVHYENAVKHVNFPANIRKECGNDLARFYQSVKSVEKDLRMMRSRTENLLRLLANRQNVISGILQYRSIQANLSFTVEAKLSADEMAEMTRDMHSIAKQTKQETVSMRVITSVTLFFLPATFMATFMSTEFLNFQDGTKSFQAEGLNLYLMITLPMTLITFLAWALIYHCTKRRQQGLNQCEQLA